jgi:hypothetical protein
VTNLRSRVDEQEVSKNLKLNCGLRYNLLAPIKTS